MSHFSRSEKEIFLKSFTQGTKTEFFFPCISLGQIQISKVRKNGLVTSSLKSFHNLLDLSQKGSLTFLNVIKFQFKPPHFYYKQNSSHLKISFTRSSRNSDQFQREGRYGDAKAISHPRHLFSMLIFWISLISCSFSSKAACIFPLLSGFQHIFHEEFSHPSLLQIKLRSVF